MRRLYGPKSEQLSEDQLRLLLEPLDADEQLRCDTPLAPAVAAKEKAPRKGGGRRPAPAHLPIERVEIDLPEAEKAGLVRIREEITEELDYQPSQFFRRHYVRFVYADPKKQTAPKLAASPPRVIAQAAVGVGLLVHLLVSKYTDHVPLYQEQIAARVGVELSRQNLCRWVEQSALLLRTIYDRLRERILKSGYVQADETPVKVLDPDRGGHAVSQDCLELRVESRCGAVAVGPSRLLPSLSVTVPQSKVQERQLEAERGKDIAQERPLDRDSGLEGQYLTCRPGDLQISIIFPIIHGAPFQPTHERRDSHHPRGEVASLLKINEKTAYRLAATGKIPGFKVGGACRFDRQELSNWIKREVEKQRAGRGNGDN